MSDERVSELTYTNQNEGGLPAELIPSFQEKIALPLTVPQPKTPNPSPHPPHSSICTSF